MIASYIKYDPNKYISWEKKNLDSSRTLLRNYQRIALSLYHSRTTYKTTPQLTKVKYGNNGICQIYYIDLISAYTSLCEVTFINLFYLM